MDIELFTNAVVSYSLRLSDDQQSLLVIDRESGRTVRNLSLALPDLDRVGLPGRGGGCLVRMDGPALEVGRDFDEPITNLVKLISLSGKEGSLSFHLGWEDGIGVIDIRQEHRFGKEEEEDELAAGRVQRSAKIAHRGTALKGKLSRTRKGREDKKPPTVHRCTQFLLCYHKLEKELSVFVRKDDLIRK